MLFIMCVGSYCNGKEIEMLQYRKVQKLALGVQHPRSYSYNAHEVVKVLEESTSHNLVLSSLLCPHDPRDDIVGVEGW